MTLMAFWKLPRAFHKPNIIIVSLCSACSEMSGVLSRTCSSLLIWFYCRLTCNGWARGFFSQADDTFVPIRSWIELGKVPALRLQYSTLTENDSSVLRAKTMSADHTVVVAAIPFSKVVRMFHYVSSRLSVASVRRRVKWISIEMSLVRNMRCSSTFIL